MGQISVKNRARFLQNPNVVRVTEKTIEFTDGFRSECLRLRREGFNYVEILIRSGFRASDFKPHYFHACFNRWRNQEKNSMQGNSKKKKDVGRPKGSQDKNFQTLENLSQRDLKSIILVQEEMINELKKRGALTKNK